MRQSSRAPAPSVCVILTVLLTISATARADDGDRTIRDGHNLLQDAPGRPTLAVGRRVPSLAFHDVEGTTVRLEEDLKNGPVAFVFLSTTCPLAKRYVERLKRLHQNYKPRGVTLVAVFPNADETLEGVRKFVATAGFTFPVARDLNGYVARRLGASMTPQALLVSQEGILLYRGAIDDHRYENRVRESYLANALGATLDGKPVERSETRAMGCSLHLAEPEGDGDITYSGHIARILQDNCQSCHRAGEVGPFPLTNYEEARRWRKEIKAYTSKRLMPPWKASPGFGEFRNDSSLSDKEIALIAKWVDAGAPRGKPEDTPPAPVFPTGWAFGQPDLIAEMPEEYVIGPEGEDDYRHFVIPYEHDHHRFVEAIDVRPGNRATVHHVIAYIDTSGKARELDAADPGPGYTRFGGPGFKPASVIGGWAPGNLPIKTLPGTGRWLPKQCDIVLQVHYYRTGVEERDRTRVGVYFSRQARPAPARSGVVANRDFSVPAGAKRHEVKASLEVKEPVYAYSVTPHMHLLGQSMVVTATRPDATVVPLIRIDAWDFNWQTTYHFRELQPLPTGTRIDVVATFDNSDANPNNPNHPPAVVSWGEKTTDEMCIAFVGWLRQSEYDPESRSRLSDR